MVKIIFWILIAVVLYTYIGYALLLLLLNLIKKLFIWKKKSSLIPDELPEVTMLIAAYNEKKIINAKMENTLNIDYPRQKLKILWITDGSDDGSSELLKQYPEAIVLHEQERKGKTAALNRAMKHVDTPFVVFSDANTMLDKSAVKKMIMSFDDPAIGCVAGEKRIASENSLTAAGVGEGAYWQYESWIKRLESKLYSALAAAGELYAIRTALFREAEPDSIIDDFVISMKIVLAGYRIRYVPEAFALESPSMNIREELKRKIRIASGGIQTLVRFPSIMNIFRNGFLSIEFISHKVLRWLVVPFAIPLILILNLIIWLSYSEPTLLYASLLVLQIIIYLFVFIGFLTESRSLRVRIFFLPYYLIIMNYAQIAGIVRFLRKKHTVVWEKARRAE